MEREKGPRGGQVRLDQTGQHPLSFGHHPLGQNSIYNPKDVDPKDVDVQNTPSFGCFNPKDIKAGQARRMSIVSLGDVNDPDHQINLYCDQMAFN